MEKRYDNICGLQLVNNTAKGCNVEITIEEDMDSPVYMYYALTNFFQNHRRYIKSRSDEQLQGDLGSSIGLCDPIKNGFKPDGTEDTNSILVPCGLIASSFFTGESKDMA